MGTQQLVLIGLGVVIIAPMVFAGILVYNAYWEHFSREQLISTIYDLSIKAQLYYKKPKEQGGGGGSFSDWQLPAYIESESSGTFRAVTREDRVNITVTGIETGLDGETNIRMTAVVNSESISIRIRN